MSHFERWEDLRLCFLCTGDDGIFGGGWTRFFGWGDLPQLASCHLHPSYTCWDWCYHSHLIHAPPVLSYTHTHSSWCFIHMQGLTHSYTHNHTLVFTFSVEFFLDSFVHIFFPISTHTTPKLLPLTRSWLLYWMITACIWDIHTQYFV